MQLSPSLASFGIIVKEFRLKSHIYQDHPATLKQTPSTIRGGPADPHERVLGSWTGTRLLNKEAF